MKTPRKHLEILQKGSVIIKLETYDLKSTELELSDPWPISRKGASNGYDLKYSLERTLRLCPQVNSRTDYLGSTITHGIFVVNLKPSISNSAVEAITNLKTPLPGSGRWCFPYQDPADRGMAHHSGPIQIDLAVGTSLRTGSEQAPDVWVLNRI